MSLVNCDRIVNAGISSTFSHSNFTIDQNLFRNRRYRGDIAVCIWFIRRRYRGLYMVYSLIIWCWKILNVNNRRIINNWTFHSAERISMRSSMRRMIAEDALCILMKHTGCYLTAVGYLKASTRHIQRIWGRGGVGGGRIGHW